MSQTPYTRQADFTGYEVENPTTPKRGTDLDAEFDAVKATVDETQANLAQIQRDDLKLANLSVHPDALSYDVRSILALQGGNVRGAWAGATSYAVKDVVTAPDTGVTYIAVDAHDSTGDFNADAAAGHWLALDQSSSVDAAIRSDLASSASGSNMVAYTPVLTVKDRLDALGNLRVDMASPAEAKGASLVGINDSGGNFTSSNVEDALGELAGRMPSQSEGVSQVIRNMNDGLAVKIVCLGDSITYGQLDAGGRAVTPWPARLQALLRQYYSNNNITVINAGVSGNTVATMAGRFAADVRAQNPDLIMFNGGTNDSRQPNAVSLSDYLQAVNQVLALCNPTPVVIWGLTPRFKEQAGGDGEDVIHLYRQVLRDAATLRGIPYIDTFNGLHNLYKTRAWAAGYFSSDGSHYTEDGYRYIGDFIFAKAFANDDIFIRPGQFKDARGQWIITDAASSTWGGGIDTQDANSLVVSNATVNLHLFVEDWTECVLAMHVTVDGANSPGQAVSVNNQSIAGAGGSFNTSPKDASALAWYANDYAVPVVRLRPGLNNIALSTVTAFRVVGFSVVPVSRDGYLTSYNTDSNETHQSNFWTAARWEASTQAFQLLRSGILVVSNNATGFVHKLCDLVPDPVSATSRWRVRATVFPGTEFLLGQQSTNDIDYMPVYKVTLDGVNAVVRVRDHAGSQIIAATVALAVAAGGADIKIDIKSGSTGWTLWINGTLIYADDIPMSMGPLLVSASPTKRSYWNPPMKKGKAASDTGVLVGETWQTFTDDKFHIVNDAGAEKTLTFA